MSTIPQVAEAMQNLLTTVAEDAANQSGFSKRRSKLTGPLFVQALVFGWLHNPQCSLSSLSQAAAALGVQVSCQGLDKRFNQQAATYIRQVLERAVGYAITSSEPAALPVLTRFSCVSLQDSSTISLPEALACIWPGCGGSAEGTAALKLHVSLELIEGLMRGPLLSDGRCHDSASALQTTQLPKGGLRIADLGYFSLDVLEALDSQGVFFLTRLKVNTLLFDPSGQSLSLEQSLKAADADMLDIPVQMERTHQIKVRLLAKRVDNDTASERRRKLKLEARKKGQAVSKARMALADWTILVTNTPSSMLSIQEALALARARWQIELLFKLWKQHGQIDQWRSNKPWRILCEVYAKLLAMLLQHWIMLMSCWPYPDKSLVKAAQTVRSYAPMLMCAINGLIALSMVIELIARCITAGCRMNPRKTHPNTYQLLLKEVA